MKPQRDPRCRDAELLGHSFLKQMLSPKHLPARACSRDTQNLPSGSPQPVWGRKAFRAEGTCGRKSASPAWAQPW